VSRDETPKLSDWLTVVGLVESTQRQDLASKPEAEIYFPYTQDLIGAHYTTLLVRSDGDPLWLAQSLRRRVRELNPQQPVAEVKTMDAWVRDSTAAPRLHTLLFEIFAGIALTLAASGVFAVVSYAVTQRTREIGIRSALGATPPDIVRFVLKLGMGPVLIGACAGIAGALAATPVLKSQLFETAPTDPAVFAAVLAILGGTAVCAAAFPAWRATQVDPATTLRAE
jgi:putative ABC transport system permease protein